MASQWVDDSSWGNVFDALGGSSKVGQVQLTAEHIKALQLKRAQDEYDWRARIELLRRQAKQFGQDMPPPPTDIPMPPNFAPGAGSDAVPFTPGNMGGAGGGGALTVTPAEPLRLSNMPPEWGVDQPFYNQRDIEQSKAGLAALTAKNPKDFAEMSGLGALTQLNLYGIPQGKPLQDIMQTQLSSVGAKLPQYEQKTQPTVHNYGIPDPATGELKFAGRTTDGLVDLMTRQPVPANAVMMGAGSATEGKGGAFTADAARAELVKPGGFMTRVNAGEHLTTPETERLGVLLDTAYPVTQAAKEEGGRLVTREVREHPIPAAFQPLADYVNAFRRGDHLKPLEQQAQAPVPFLPQNVMPTVSMPLPQAPQLPQMTNAPSEPVNRGPINANNLADNLRAEPDYKTYATILREWNTLTRYAQGSPPDGNFNNSTDLAIIYGIAKLFDPDSAVREGELTLTQALGTLPERLRVLIGRNFDGTGTLPAQVRADLLHAGQQKMLQAKEQWDTLVEDYTRRATRGSVDPDDVIRTMGTPKDLDYRDVVERGKRTAGASSSPDLDPEVVRRNRERLGAPGGR